MRSTYQTQKRRVKKRHQHDAVDCAYNLDRTQNTYGKSPSETFDYDIKHKRRHAKEKFKHNPTLRYYSKIWAWYKPRLRQKSFQRLLHVFVQLLYDYATYKGIYKRVSHRETTSTRDPIEYLQKIQTADVEQIIDASRYTARSYAYIVRSIAKMIQTSGMIQRDY